MSAPSRDLLGFPVTHSCPATHSFHPYQFPLLLYMQMEFQELSGQLVLIPLLVPSGFWDLSILFTYSGQRFGEATAQPTGWSWVILHDVAFTEGILRAECVRRKGRNSRRQHPNWSLDQELTPSHLFLQQPSRVADSRPGNNDQALSHLRGNHRPHQSHTDCRAPQPTLCPPAGTGHVRNPA